MSFANLEKAFLASKVLSQKNFSKISGKSFDHEMNDLMTNHEWPTPKLENWKYTNITKLAQVEFLFAQRPIPKILPEFWQNYLDAKDFDSAFVFFNGEYCALLSRISKNDQFRFEQMPSFMLGPSSAIEKMNQLLIKDVLRLEIKRNVQIEKPIAVLFLSDPDVSQNQIHASRLQVILENLSQAEIFEIHASLSGADLEMTGSQQTHQVTNHMCEFSLGDSARLQHNFLNMTSKMSTNFFNKKFELARSSFLRSLHIDLGGALSRVETYVRLNEPGAEAYVNGLYLNNERQHTDHQGVIQHLAPETMSHQLFKGILADQSRAVFNARIRIEQTAPKSSAEQLNKNLLLSERVEIDSLPRLEIFNDDVKASHGATSGRIDPDQVFYLLSRAISHERAMRLLVEGYALEMLSDTTSTMASKIQYFISQKLREFKNVFALEKEVRT